MEYAISSAAALPSEGTKKNKVDVPHKRNDSQSGHHSAYAEHPLCFFWSIHLEHPHPPLSPVPQPALPSTVEKNFCSMVCLERCAPGSMMGSASFSRSNGFTTAQPFSSRRAVIAPASNTEVTLLLTDPKSSP